MLPSAEYNIDEGVSMRVDLFVLTFCFQTSSHVLSQQSSPDHTLVGTLHIYYVTRFAECGG